MRKQISHEEASECLSRIGKIKIAEKFGVCPLRDSIDYSASWEEIKDYISQQEAYEKQASKERELLELYRLYNEFLERYYTSDRLLDKQKDLDTLRELREEITKLEKELKENEKTSL